MSRQIIKAALSVLRMAWRSRPWWYHCLVAGLLVGVHYLIIYLRAYGLATLSDTKETVDYRLLSAFSGIALAPINLYLIPIFGAVHACWLNSQRSLLPRLRVTLWSVLAITCLPTGTWVWLTATGGWGWLLSGSAMATNIAVATLPIVNRTRYSLVVMVSAGSLYLGVSVDSRLLLPALILCTMACLVCLGALLRSPATVMDKARQRVANTPSRSRTRLARAERWLTRGQEPILARLDLVSPRAWLAALAMKHLSRTQRLRHQLALVTWAPGPMSLSFWARTLPVFLLMLWAINALPGVAGSVGFVVSGVIPFGCCGIALIAIYDHFVSIRPSLARVWLAGSWRDSAHFARQYGVQVIACKARSTLLECTLLVVATLTTDAWNWSLCGLALIGLIVLNALGMGVLFLLLQRPKRHSTLMRVVSSGLIFVGTILVVSLSGVAAGMDVWLAVIVAMSLLATLLWTWYWFGANRCMPFETYLR